jgi:hypothetical protein
MSFSVRKSRSEGMRQVQYSMSSELAAARPGAHATRDKEHGARNVGWSMRLG